VKVDATAEASSEMRDIGSVSDLYVEDSLIVLPNVGTIHVSEGALFHDQRKKKPVELYVNSGTISEGVTQSEEQLDPGTTYQLPNKVALDGGEIFFSARSIVGIREQPARLDGGIFMVMVAFCAAITVLIGMHRIPWNFAYFLPAIIVAVLFSIIALYQKWHFRTQNNRESFFPVPA
jgi:hypothetical protein